MSPLRSPFRLDRRAAAILLHPTSLPGPHGCGDLGSEAYAFIDFLADATVRWWQMLPTGPIGPGNSPYASSSAFAGSALLIDLRRLAANGLLTPSEIRPLPGPAGRVRYTSTIKFRNSRLWSAFERFRAGGGTTRADYRHFIENNCNWLDDYALFETLHEAGGWRPWTTWPTPLRDRKSDALRDAVQQHADRFEYQRFVQFEFGRQWTALRRYAHERGVGLIGDIPIFGAHDSADVWACPELYTLDSRGVPTALTGCPPDHFNAEGQLWGHPQYNWKQHEQTGFQWWIARFRALLHQFDAARIDHFLGFNRVWWLAGDAKTARHGHWVKTPGDALFAAVRRELGDVNIIAEDLGVATPEAYALRDKYRFPGMRIMTCGFGSDDPGAHYHLPHCYVPACVAYTGTHDNETAVGWYERIGREHRARKFAGSLSEFERVERYFARTSEPLHWRLIRALYSSSADLIGIPLQDLLGLGTKHRMNIPGTPERNWEWRAPPDALAPALATRLREFAIAYMR